MQKINHERFKPASGQARPGQVRHQRKKKHFCLPPKAPKPQKPPQRQALERGGATGHKGTVAPLELGPGIWDDASGRGEGGDSAVPFLSTGLFLSFFAFFALLLVLASPEPKAR
jgi:hypothetical protein